MTEQDKPVCAANLRSEAMIAAVKTAVALGYDMAVPGKSGPAFRWAFPELFATDDEKNGVPISDDLEVMEYPVVSRSETGAWVCCWQWVGK